MKKNDWILAATVGAYSFLFYQQSAGINYVLFNSIIITALLLKDSGLLKSKAWLLATAGSLLSSLCIGYYGNALSVIANIISLSILSGLSLNPKSSVVFTLLFSFYSYFSSLVYLFLDWLERKQNQTTRSVSPSVRKSILIVIPLLITALFFFMYKQSNPLFNEFAKNINLDFISLNWITFTFGGFLLLYGFFYQRKIKAISDFDEKASNNLAPTTTTIELFGKQLSINDEDFSGKVLFVMLNILLLTVNILDVNFLFIDHKLPEGVTYSEFVHQGTGMIITSIITAIAIILFYFRGALNFSEKSKVLKVMAYLWILQNVFMLISTGFRNDMYIAEYGLTYKRIGVYFYLFLAALGLITTFIKILKVKSNVYLFRVNGWLFYAVLIAACVFNWDALITRFNINDAKKLEKNYLLSLSDAGLPQLMALQHDTITKHEEFTLEEKESSRAYRDFNSSDDQPDYKEQLSRKLYDFNLKRETLCWKSWYLSNSKINKDLLQLNSTNKITALHLSYYYISTLEPIKAYTNITELYLNTNAIKSISELQYFTKLKKVDLSNNYLMNVKGIEKFKDLVYLNITKNRIHDFYPLYKLTGLKELHVPATIKSYQLKELQEALPNTLIFTT